VDAAAVTYTKQHGRIQL